jgi:maltose O-acetyltransferase
VTDPDYRSGPDATDRTQRQRMLAGDRYLADDPELVADHERVMQLLEAYNGNPAEGAAARGVLLNELFAAFGAGSDIRPPLYCDYGYNVRVGARTFANFGLVALDVAPIVIGDDVQIGPNVQLLTATHPVEAGARLAKWESGRPITIADNVWLGGGAIVLAGVTIGENSVIGAGAVVTRDIPPDTVAVGNPARAIRQLQGDVGPDPAAT